MNPIRNLPGLPSDFNLKKVGKKEDLKHATRAEESVPDKSSEKVTSLGNDNVKISDAGKLLLNREQEIQNFLIKIPQIETISKEEIHSIQDKIAKDFYSQPEVLNKVIEALLTLPAIKSTSVKGSQNASDSAKTNLDPQRLAEIRDKIQNGEYETGTVVNMIVEELLKAEEFNLS